MVNDTFSQHLEHSEDMHDTLLHGIVHGLLHSCQIHYHSAIPRGLFIFLTMVSVIPGGAGVISNGVCIFVVPRILYWPANIRTLVLNSVITAALLSGYLGVKGKQIV